MNGAEGLVPPGPEFFNEYNWIFGLTEMYIKINVIHGSAQNTKGKIVKCIINILINVLICFLLLLILIFLT